MDGNLRKLPCIGEQFHRNCPSKTLSYGKIKSVFRDVK